MKRKLFEPLLMADGNGGGGSASGDGDISQTFDDVVAGSEDFKQALDAKIQEALNQQKIDFEKKAKEDAEKSELEKLPEKEKQEKLLKAEKERADKAEAEKNAMVLKQEALQMLGEKKLPAGAIDLVMGVSAEETKVKVEGLAKILEEYAANQIKEKMPGYSPKGADADGEGGTKKGFIETIRSYQAKRR